MKRVLKKLAVLILLACFSFVLVKSGLNSQRIVSAEVQKTIRNLTTNEIINNVIAAKSDASDVADNPVSTKLFDYYISAGQVADGAVSLTAMSTATPGRLTEINRDLKAIPNNQFNIGNKGSFIDYSIIISFTIHEDGRLFVSNEAGTASNTGLKVSVLKESSSVLTSVGEDVLVPTAIDENLFAREVEVNDGDKVYWVLSNSTAYQRYLNKEAFPFFSFKEKVEYSDALPLVTELTAANAILNTKSGVTVGETADNAVKTRLFDYYVSTSLIEGGSMKLHALTAGSDRLTESNRSIQVIPTNLIRIGIRGESINYSVAFSFTFKDSGKFTITNAAGTASNTGLAVTVYRERNDVLETVIDTVDVPTTISAGLFDGEVDVERYDTIYWVLSSKTNEERDIRKAAYPTFGFEDYKLYSFVSLSTQASLSAAYSENAGEYSFGVGEGVNLRFGIVFAKSIYDNLISLGVSNSNFGIYITDGANETHKTGFSLARVNSSGIESIDGDYYQYSLIINNIPLSNFTTELTAKCYVEYSGDKYYLGDSTYSVKSLAAYYVDNLPGNEMVVEHNGFLTYLKTYGE